MDQTKVKIEFVLISLLVTIISGVVLWFILDRFASNLSIEISVFITSLLISAIIIYSLHGRGILPIPETEQLPIIANSGKKINSFYSRKKYLVFTRTEKKNLFKPQIIKKKYSSFNYERKKIKK